MSSQFMARSYNIVAGAWRQRYTVTPISTAVFRGCCAKLIGWNSTTKIFQKRDVIQ
jgi:hypothetical protein